MRVPRSIPAAVRVAPTRASADGGPSPVAIALALIIAVLPLVVRLEVVPLTGAAFDYWTGQPVNYDFFSYWKARAFVAFAALAAVALVAERRGGRQDRRAPWAWVPAGAVTLYGLVVATSAALSPYPALAATGFADRYEGVWVLLGYVGVFLAAWRGFHDDRHARPLAVAFAVVAAIVTTIGVCQFFSLDVFRTAFGRWLIVPSAAAVMARSLGFPNGPGDVYGTLYHYNYMGSFCALLLPLLATLSLTRDMPSRLRRAAVLAAFPVAWCGLACGSRGGLIGAVVGIAFVVVMFRARWLRRASGYVILAVLCVLVALLATGVFGGRVTGRVAALVADVAALFAPGPVTPKPDLPIKGVTVDGHALTLVFRPSTLHVSHVGGDLRFTGPDGTPMAAAFDPATQRISLPDDRFQRADFRLAVLHGRPTLVVAEDAYRLYFAITPAGFEQTLNTGVSVAGRRVPALGFTGRERLGSGRAYIWSRSIPLLGDRFWIGSGPDTFAAVFPQHDTAGKFRVYGTTDMLVDKPHNWFLQAAVNTGVVSALCLLGLVAWTVAGGARRYWRSPPAGLADGLTAACVAGVVGYAVAALFNDSAVSVAPVFWVALGLACRSAGRTS